MTTAGTRYIRPHSWGGKVALNRDDDRFRCRWCGLEAVRHSGPTIVNLPVEHCPEAPVPQTAKLPIQLVATLARALYMSTLVGDPAPVIERLGERMCTPRPGDLVAETSTWLYSTAYGHRDDLTGLGWLVAIDRELVEDEENPGELRDVGPRYVIEPLDRPGETFAWGNAGFIALPTSAAQLEEWEGLL